ASLNSESYYARVAAQEALADRGSDGVNAVLAALEKGKLGVAARIHAVWVLARTRPEASLDKLFELARNDADARVQVQAVRAIADLADPVLVHHRLGDQRGDVQTAERLADLVEGRNRIEDPSGAVVLEVVVALGRMRWANAPGRLCKFAHQTARTTGL